MEEQYKELITEIIKKQIVILGKDLALIKARNVSAITIDSDGIVLSVSGNPQQALNHIMSEYSSLLGATAKNIVKPVLEKYPDLKISLDI